MSSDNLTVILFLVGTGIAFGLAAMSAAEWRHPFVIYALCVAAAIFILAALWVWIGRTPAGVLAIIATVAKSPIAWFVVLMAVALVASVGRTVSGFNPPWPDAIRCSMKEWQSTVASEFIFYYRGLGISRASVGPVIVYYMPGGYNDKEGYFPHEIWFERDSRKLIPTKRIPEYTKDLIEQRYKAAFPYELDCGEGSIDDALEHTSIDTIKSRNRAYFFARPMK